MFFKAPSAPVPWGLCFWEDPTHPGSSATSPCPTSRLLLPLMCRKFLAYVNPFSPKLSGLLPSRADPWPCSLTLTH